MEGGTSSRTHALPERFAALDGWRGICALLVVAFHAPVAGSVAAIGLVRHGFLFVDFFFVLSGFVIAHAYADKLRREGDLAGFMIGRLARVYPLHLAMLLLFVGFELVMFASRGPEGAFQEGNRPDALLPNVLMIHSLGTVDGLGWNYPSWSISAELVAYALFALLAVRLAGRRLVAVLLLAVPPALLVVLLAEGTIDTSVTFGWLRCVAGFFLGAAMRLTLWTRRPADSGEDVAVTALWTLAEAAAIVMVVAFVAIVGGTALSIAAPVIFAYAIYVFAHEGGWISRLLKTRPIGWCGLVSYSIYMTHAFVISRAENIATVLASRTGWSIFTYVDGKRLMGATELEALLALLLVLAATLVASAVTYRLIERPGMALGRRLSRPGRPLPVPTAARWVPPFG